MSDEYGKPEEKIRALEIICLEYLEIIQSLEKENAELKKKIKEMQPVYDKETGVVGTGKFSPDIYALVQENKELKIMGEKEAENNLALGKKCNEYEEKLLDLNEEYKRFKKSLEEKIKELKEAVRELFIFIDSCEIVYMTRGVEMFKEDLEKYRHLIEGGEDEKVIGGYLTKDPEIEAEIRKELGEKESE